VVPAAADGQLKAGLPGALDNPSNLLRTSYPHHRGGPAINALEEDLPRPVVGGIVWADHLALQLRTETADRNVVGLLC
jgi:hypothetical protein